MLADQRLAEAYLAAGRADDAVSWFHWIIDTQTGSSGPITPI